MSPHTRSCWTHRYKIQALTAEMCFWMLSVLASDWLQLSQDGWYWLHDNPWWKWVGEVDWLVGCSRCLFPPTCWQQGQQCHLLGLPSIGHNQKSGMCQDINSKIQSKNRGLNVERCLYFLYSLLQNYIQNHLNTLETSKEIYITSTVFINLNTLFI